MNETENKMMVHNAVERVSKLLGDVSTAEIMSKNRTYRVATARQLVYWYLWQVCKMSFTDIGRAIGRNHATIMWGVQQAEIIISRNRSYDRRIHDAAVALREQDTRAVEINN